MANAMAWLYFALFWYIDMADSGSLITSCLNFQPGITGKKCVNLVDFTAENIPSKLRCAELCRDTCVSVFYSSTTKQCIGCKGMYDSGSGLGTLQDSVYFIRKWHYEYVGCFRDCQNIHPCPRRVMQYKNWSYSMTIEMCADICKPYGLKYFATQNALTCYCGDDTYDMDGTATNCNDACAGNSSQICGGWSANSVYEFVFEC